MKFSVFISVTISVSFSGWSGGGNVAASSRTKCHARGMCALFTQRESV